MREWKEGPVNDHSLTEKSSQKISRAVGIPANSLDLIHRLEPKFACSGSANECTNSAAFEGLREQIGGELYTIWPAVCGKNCNAGQIDREGAAPREDLGEKRGGEVQAKGSDCFPLGLIIGGEHLNMESAESQVRYIKSRGKQGTDLLEEKLPVGLIHHSAPVILLVGFVGEGIAWGAVLHSMQGIIGFACIKGFRFEYGHRQSTKYEFPFSYRGSMRVAHIHFRVDKAQGKAGMGKTKNCGGVSSNTPRNKQYGHVVPQTARFKPQNSYYFGTFGPKNTYPTDMFQHAFLSGSCVIR